MSDTSPAALARLRELASQATPGPWAAAEMRGNGEVLLRTTERPPLLLGTVVQCHERYRAVDLAHYLAALDPATVLALLDELEALRALVADALPAVTGLQDPSLSLVRRLRAALPPTLEP